MDKILVEVYFPAVGKNFDVEMPVNLVFLLMFCFVLVVLLSLSIAISQLAEKCRRLTQANAILEKRVRDLENRMQSK